MVFRWFMYMFLVQGLLFIILLGLFCLLSDFMGRKFFVLVSFIGIFLKIFFMIVVVNLNWNIYSFLVFVFIDGCCGIWVIQFVMFMVMVLDLIMVEGKLWFFLIMVVGFFISLGYVFGFFVLGFIVERFGYGWSLGIFSIVIMVLMFLLCFMEENLLENKKVNLNCDLKLYFKNFVQFYVEDDLINLEFFKWKYIFCLFVFVCILLLRLGVFSVEFYYVMDSFFCFNLLKIGIF